MTHHAASALQHAWTPLLSAMPLAAWIVDGRSLQVCQANEAAALLLGVPCAQLVGKDATALIATPEDMAHWEDVRAGQLGRLQSDTVLVDATGRLVPVTRTIGTLHSDVSHPCLLVTVEDRTEATREQEARESLVAELQATLESTGDGILVTDMAGRIRGFNRRFAQIWGMPEDLLRMHHDAAVFDWMQRSVVDGDLYQSRVDAIQEATMLQATERITLHSGQELERVTQPQSSRGRPCGRVWAFRDLTDLVIAGRRIETLSTTDALTGLYNRHEIGERLGAALRQAHRDGGTLALLVLDLDRFKHINDSLGHEVGDRVLLDTAERLKGCLRQGDLVARIGGDQFALLVHGADHRGAEASARRVLSALSHPCSMDACSSR